MGDECGVGQAAGDAAHERAHAVEGRDLAVALVELEGSFVDVAGQMLGQDVVLGAVDGALEHGPDRFDAVGVDIAARILAFAVVYRLVREGVGQGRVGRRRVDERARCDVALHKTDQGRGVRVGEGLDLAAPLAHADHRGLAHRAASLV